MTKIIDNRTLTMANELTKEIRNVNEIAIASAYFNVRGFSLIKDALMEKKLKFLLGKEPQTNVAYRDEILQELENEAIENEDDLKFFSELNNAVKYFNKDNDEVQVRIVKEGFFHGKVYMGASPDLQNINYGFGITGSSNFTYSGLTSNMELNMLATDREAVQELSKWFDDLWNSSEDFKKEFIEFLSNYVTAHSPLEIVAKALHETLKDRLDIAEKVPTIGDLYLHQKLSVSQAWDIINKYGGVILADPVGLGKTRVGISLAYIALRYGMKPLVIAPKSILNTTWKKEMEDVLGLEIPSINTEKVSANPDILNKYYNDKNFIIIDEAHYFRSSSSQRFSGLSSYLARKDRKLVLITATPVNNSLMDLYNLLSLFINDDEIPGKPSLKGYFSEQQKKLYNDERVDLDDLLRMFVVRTSRPTAQKLSRNLSFPSRVIDTNGVAYKLPLNPEEISNKIDEMTFIYYDMAVDKQVKGITLPDGLPIDENMQKIMKEKLKELVKVVIKINYFKRIESSIYSFKKSLEKQKEYIEKTVKIAQNDKKFIPPKFKTKIYGDEISGFDLSEIPEDYLEHLSMTDEESNTYIENANKDIGIINSIIEKINENEDCKFNTFYKKLKSIKIEGKNGIIIFTSYADTAKFIYDKLSMMDPEIKDKLLLITGNEAHGNNSSDRFEIINYFMNNGGYLVSTDVLSAGQNLQNAQYVFNYDFPWNPVVLIQRTGRIDRLRSPYNEIYIINMTPDNGNKEDPSSLEETQGKD
jgi:superfamily II DNA or RNA helicase